MASPEKGGGGGGGGGASLDIEKLFEGLGDKAEMAVHLALPYYMAGKYFLETFALKAIAVGGAVGTALAMGVTLVREFFSNFSIDVGMGGGGGGGGGKGKKGGH